MVSYTLSCTRGAATDFAASGCVVRISRTGPFSGSVSISFRTRFAFSSSSFGANATEPLVKGTPGDDPAPLTFFQEDQSHCLDEYGGDAR